MSDLSVNYTVSDSKQTTQDGISTYSAARDATSSIVYTLNSGINNILHNSFIGGSFFVRRGDLQFDTSSIPLGATIISATLIMRANSSGGSNANGDTVVALDNTNNPNLGSVLTSEDMDDFTSVSIGSEPLSSYTNTGADVDLSLTDFAVINTGGVTRIGLRLKNDIDNVTPTGSNVLRVDTSRTCSLSVTYTTGGGTPYRAKQNFPRL